MNRREDQHTEARELKRHLHRFSAAQLTDEDHVRVLSPSAPNRVGEAGGVIAHFAVGNLALLRPVDELDRIFNRENVPFTVPVDVIEHGRERGALSASGRAGHQDQPRALFRELDDRMG